MRMNRWSTILVTAAVLIGLPLSAQQREAKPASDARLANWILTGSQAEKEGSVSYVLTIPANERGQLVQDALMKEMARLNAERFSRLSLARAGKQVVAEDQDGSERFGEYRGMVTQAVSQSSNSAVIPVLIGALGSGPIVSKALAKFGPAAITPLAKVARENHPDRHAVADALHALRDILDSGAVLSREARDSVLTVAVERLTGPQHFVIVAAACDLAVSTSDVTLRRRVQQLAGDSAQRAAMGITDVETSAFVQKAASRALTRKRD
jgi:hypothetical protein